MPRGCTGRGSPSLGCVLERAEGALHLDPENPWPFVGMGLVYVRWGLLAEARPPIAAALKQACLASRRHCGRRACCSRRRASPRRRKPGCVRRSPSWHAPRFRTYLAMLLSGLPGGAADARALLMRSVEAWPEQPEALRELSRLARAADDARAGAATAGEQLVALQPRDHEAHRLQAEAWLAAGDKAKAARCWSATRSWAAWSPRSLALRGVSCTVELDRRRTEAKALVRLAAARARGSGAAACAWRSWPRRAEIRGGWSPPVDRRPARRPPAPTSTCCGRGWCSSRSVYLDAVVAYRAALAAPERRVARGRRSEAAALEHAASGCRRDARGGRQDQIYDRVSRAWSRSTWTGS